MLEHFPTAHFFLINFASRTNGTFGFAQHPDRYREQPFAKPKEPFSPSLRRKSVS